MKNINREKGYPTIKDTSCITCGFNELIGVMLKRKSELRNTYYDYRDHIRYLAHLELIDRCYMARLHELQVNHQVWMDEIRSINNLRSRNKQDRLSCIHKITDIKREIKRQTSLIHDLHNVVRDIHLKYNGEKYQDFKYNHRLTTYSDGQMKFDAVVLRPIQFIGIPDKAIHARFEPITPRVTVEERESSN